MFAKFIAILFFWLGWWFIAILCAAIAGGAPGNEENAFPAMMIIGFSPLVLWFLRKVWIAKKTKQPIFSNREDVILFFLPFVLAFLFLGYPNYLDLKSLDV